MKRLSGIIFKDLLQPFILAGSTLKAVAQNYRELLFFLLAFAFAFCLTAVVEMNRFQTCYYRYVHRGIWEDVMVSKPTYQDFVPEFTDANSNADHTLTKLRETIKKVLGKIDHDLILSKRIDGRMKVDKVLIDGKEVSMLRGEIDIWIKAFEPQSSIQESLKRIPQGAVVISKHLAQKLSRQLIANPQKAEIHLSKWGESLTQPFVIRQIIDLGGYYNVVFPNPNDLKKLGFRNAINVIGIKLRKRDPGRIKEKLVKALESSLWIETIDERENLAETLFFIKLAPLLLLLLFGFIMLVNYYYMCLHNCELRNNELKLLSFYNYGKMRRLILFFSVNITSGVAGFALATISAGLGLSYLFSKMVLNYDGLPCRVALFNTVFNLYTTSALLLIVALCFLLTWLVCRQKRDAIGS